MAAGSLSGHVAIVTGAGRGFGQAIALRLAAEGAAVTVTSRTASQLAETVARIEERGGEALAVAADVTRAADVGRVVSETRGRFGPVTLLVSNAGVPDPFGPVWEVDPEQWWAAQAVHIRAPMLFLRAVMPEMVARRAGRIIVVSALASRVVAPNLSAYCVGKIAQVRLVEQAAAEAREHGVRVFAIDPGFVITALAEATMNSPDAQRWLPGMVQRLHERAALSQAEGSRDLERCAQRCVDLASGRYDALSGKYMELDDDLDAWLAGKPPGERPVPGAKK
jgi:NAD(P)-dependent dehydrogenase (short-subunit alcohol dehydrogenase family)